VRFVDVLKGKGSPYSITDRRFAELIPVLGSQPAGDVSHKPGGRLPLLAARPAVTIATLRGLLPISLVGEQRHNGPLGVNSLPKSVTRQRCGCDLNPGPTAPESSTLTTRLPSHPALINESQSVSISMLAVAQDTTQPTRRSRGVRPLTSLQRRKRTLHLSTSLPYGPLRENMMSSTKPE